MEQADSLVLVGDTAGAISLLRETAPRCDTDDIWGHLGTLLVRTSPAGEEACATRLEGEEALERARRLDPDDPRWYLALGLLARKRGIRVDADRIFLRALELDEEASPDERLSRRQRAEIHAERGRMLEEVAADFRGLVLDPGEIPVNTPRCSNLGAFCRNFTRPESFHETLLAAPTDEALVADRIRALRREFERAFELDPGSAVAARGLLAELARRGAWDRFVEVAARHARKARDVGWPTIFLGAGLHRTGDEEAAEGAFLRGLERLPPDERAVLEEIGFIVAREVEEEYRSRPPGAREAYARLLWKISDPLYLTDVNERRLEHFTRTALAELRFGDPLSDRRGYETHRGRILIRYGEPTWTRQIARDPARSRAVTELSFEGRAFREDMARSPVARPSGPGADFGGRWIFWTYRDDLPSFIFEKHLTRRTVEHAQGTFSLQYEEDARAEIPSAYDLPGVAGIPHQLVRFRGTAAPAEIDVYAGLPEDAAQPPRSGRAGLFFLPRTPGDTVTGLVSPARFGPGRRAVTFRVALAAGRYPYSVEARTDDGELTGRGQGVADLEGFPTRGFGLSDILLARRISPREREVAEVEDRRDLRLVPSVDLRFGVDEPVALYFEVYGLTWEAGGEDERREARYRVSLRVEDARERGILGRVVRSLGGLLGGEGEGTEIRWERSVEGLRARVPEWLTLALPGAEAGEYSIRITVEDIGSGNEVERARRFTVGR